MSASLIAYDIPDDPVNDRIVNKRIVPYLRRLNKKLKDRPVNESFYKFIDYCHGDQALSVEALPALLQTAFPLDEKQQPALTSDGLKERLNVLRNIGELGGGAALSAEALKEHQDDLNSYFLQLFKQVIPVETEEGFSKKYHSSFGSCRRPQALLQYAASLKKLPANDRSPALSALARYVDHVLNGVDVFKQKRLETADNLHLKNLFGIYPDLKEAWAQEVKKPLGVTKASEEAKMNIKNYFYEKVVIDRHIGLPLFTAYLINAHLKGKTDEVYLSLSATAAEKLLADATKSSFHELTIQQQKDHFDKIIRQLDLPDGHSFLNDLQSLKSMLEGKGASDQGLTLQLTDDPYDLLLCGTEILGSCQKVDGDPQLNKGLLGYLLDGKNRLLAIKQSDGKLVARSLLRLAWDDEEKRALLFLVRAYPDNLSETNKNAIVEFARTRARELKLDLVSVEVGAGDGYPHLIRGLGGPAPFEYVDEANAIAPNGIYTTRQAHYLAKYAP